MNASSDKIEQLPLLRRPVKPGQTPPIGLTPQEVIGKVEKAKANEERGGPEGAEPTRFGDWERKGRCSDF